MPHIYKKDITKKISNNKKISFLGEDCILSKEEILNRINALFKSDRYVFNISVYIKTRDNFYDTKIISLENDTLLTIDDDSIPINDIIDFKIKDRI